MFAGGGGGGRGGGGKFSHRFPHELTEHPQCYLGPSTAGSLLGRILGAGASFPAYAFLGVFDLGDTLRPFMTGTIDDLMATATWVRVRVKSRD